MRFIIRLLINMTSILIIAYLLPRVIWVDGVMAALAAAFLLGIVNVIIRPILVFFTFPLTILTLGLFLFVINGLMLGLVAYFVSGFHVNGFAGAVLGALLISIVTWILTKTLSK
ncbi:MAG: phage holin family protein [Proteobacteria bacterium]|nr:phage holin family protein [Pseudomonadota bacterium]